MTSAGQLLRTGVLTIVWLLVVASLIILWSAVVPIVPWLRLYAADVVPNAAPWFLIAALAALGIAIAFDRWRTTGVTQTLRLVAAATAVTAAGVVGHFLSIAYSNHVRVSVAQTLALRHFSDGSRPNDSHVYSAPGGEPLRLDVYRPPERRPQARSPVMVVVHGGGFIGGTRHVGAANMRHYAQQGWTVVSIDYRLARPGRPTWNLAVRDVHCALGWVASHADTLNVDLTRLTLSGASSGGHLAMVAAYSIATGRVNTACGARLPRPSAVWVKAPLIDPRNSWDTVSELQQTQRMYLTMYMGGSPQRYPERYATLDLGRYADRRNSPTLIMAGRDDPLLPVEDVEAFAAEARLRGADVRLVLFPYSGHDFNTTYGSITNQIVIGVIQQFVAEHSAG
jgi:acetyl esterase